MVRNNLSGTSRLYNTLGLDEFIRYGAEFLQYSHDGKKHCANFHARKYIGKRRYTFILLCNFFIINPGHSLGFILYPLYLLGCGITDSSTQLRNMSIITSVGSGYDILSRSNLKVSEGKYNSATTSTSHDTYR